MVCVKSSSLLGMLRHHVTALLAAILVCSVMATSVQSASKAQLFNLLDTDEAQAQHSDPSTSNPLPPHYHPLPRPHHPHSSSSSSSSDSHVRINHDQQPRATSGSDVINRGEEEAEQKEAGSSSQDQNSKSSKPSSSSSSSSFSAPAQQQQQQQQQQSNKNNNKPSSTFDFNEWRKMYEGRVPADAFTKRFLQGFVGSRGKRAAGDVSVLPAAFGQWAELYRRGHDDGDAVLTNKRFPNAFYGSRGKRGMEEEESEEEMPIFDAFYNQGKRGLGFGSRLGGVGGDEGAAGRDGHVVHRRYFNPASFTASRGKRYMPGLQALLLSQMYQKLNADKWKRQSMLGFHAARG